MKCLCTLRLDEDADDNDDDGDVIIVEQWQVEDKCHRICGLLSNGPQWLHFSLQHAKCSALLTPAPCLPVAG